MNNCILCGTPLKEDGTCPNDHGFKKMCINCSFCKENEDGTYICTNSENLETVKKKMLEAAKAVSSGYEIEMDLKPLPLKKPLIKCGQWEISDVVKNHIFDLFV